VCACGCLYVCVFVCVHVCVQRIPPLGQIASDSSNPDRPTTSSGGHGRRTFTEGKPVNPAKKPGSVHSCFSTL